MKRILALVLLTLILTLNSQKVLAQELASSQSATAVQETEYQLPYPGILPDNPLYFLKAARDKIVSFLISDPLKKAEFDILQADKRLAAGNYLSQKKAKEELMISTISKGENYFEAGIKEVREAKKQGINIKDTVNKMYLSSKKHQAVLKILERKVSTKNKNGLVILEQRVGNFEKEVSLLR